MTQKGRKTKNLPTNKDGRGGDKIGDPSNSMPLESVIPLLIKERVREQQMLQFIPAGSNMSRDEFLAKENKLEALNALGTLQLRKFLKNQHKRNNAVIDYIKKAVDLAEASNGNYPRKKYTGLCTKLVAAPSLGRIGLKVIPPEQLENEEDTIRIKVLPHITTWISDNIETLEELHSANWPTHAAPLVPQDFSPKADYKLSEHQRSKLKILQGQFESRAKEYPHLQHIVISWPFMHLHPRPPKEDFPVFDLKEQKKFNYSLMTSGLGPCPFITEKILTRSWYKYWPEPDCLEDAQIRFKELANEAGQTIAEVLFNFSPKINFKIAGRIQSETCKPGAVNAWLTAIHLYRKTLVSYDGWDGLFDPGTDFSEEGFRSGLYNYWKSSNLFLDSAMLCDSLLVEHNVKNPTDSITLPVKTKKFNGSQSTLTLAVKDDGHLNTINENPSIEKKKPFWIFRFKGEEAKVSCRKKNGLKLIEHLLLNRNHEYTPLGLLKATGLRGEHEKEPEPIYTEEQIEEIKKAIQGLEERAAATSDPTEKERLNDEIEKAKRQLYKDRNCRGESRKTSEAHIKAVDRPLKAVIHEIAPQNISLYEHFRAYLTTGTKPAYKPHDKIVWDIS